MERCHRILPALFWAMLVFSAISQAQQPWNGIVSTARAANWNGAGLISLPRDVAPDASWTQCGSTIAAYGSSGSYASPSTVQTTINNCGANQYVLLGAGDFYLTGGVSLKSNMVLRGSGATQTRIHANPGSTCPTGIVGMVCVTGSNTYSGYCLPNIGGTTYNMWSCPSGDFTPGYQHTANWTSSYSQGALTITLDSVAGIVVNQTPIILDQCDAGFTGSSGVENCSGTGGVITAASVWSGGGGSGYNVGDTGRIICSPNNGRCYGGYNSTYTVTSVSSGMVTGFTVTNGGTGYTYSNVGFQGTGAPTIATAGSGTGLLVSITGVTGYDNNSLFACGIEMICAVQSDAGTSRPARSQQEIVLATAITGTGPYTVTISHPILHPNWASNQSPQAWWGSSTITNTGVENMMLDASGATTSCVVEQTATGVWVSGIACSTANFFHVFETVVSNTLVKNSYFYRTKSAGVMSYGVGSAGAVGNALYENNIIQGVVDPLNADGSCAGCVFAYNFALNQYDTASDYLFASSPMHAGSTDYILEEGNIGSTFDGDSNHGPHFMNTFFRNYWNGYESNNGTMPLYLTVPVVLQAFSRYNNFLGNVLGTSGYHKYYQCVPSSTSTGTCSHYGGYAGYLHIWDSGWSAVSQIDFTNSPKLPNDPLTGSSLYRYGNYDTVNGSVQWNSTEVPTTDPNFPNQVPSNNTFPSSFYNGLTGAYSNCGTGLTFWKNPTTGSCPPYPSIGPDVTNGDIGMCTSGTYKWSRALNSSQCAGGSFTASVNGGFANSNPAMRCYLNQMGGTPDGTGGMLTFDPAACYANDPNSSSGNSPAAPLNLNGAVTVSN